MTRFNLKASVAVAAMALGFAAFGATPSYARTTDNVGVRTTMIDSGDELTGKEVVTNVAPTKGNSTVTVTETLHYLNSPWAINFWSHNKAYTIVHTGTAQFVDRVGSWMWKDENGNFYRFNAGSAAGVATSKPVVGIGAQGSVLAGNDSGFVSAVSGGAASADNSTRLFNVTTQYTHVEPFDDVTYTVGSGVNAVFVPQQGAHFAWIGSALYTDANGNVHALSSKPTANAGARNDKIASDDRRANNNVVVSAGGTSFDGNSRGLSVTRNWVHEETYQSLLYTTTSNEPAVLVPEQRAYMAWVDGNLYRVGLGSNYVEALAYKPVVRVGSRFSASWGDQMVDYNVVPLRLSNDGHAVVVNVQRVYHHNDTFQVLEYTTDDIETAYHNDSYGAWVVTVDGRVFGIAFDGDTINNGSVTVVHAPSSLHRPSIVVVPSNDGGPGVVIPGKGSSSAPSGNDDGPGVVVPGNDHGNRGPVVVPPSSDDDGPGAVVPSNNHGGRAPVSVPPSSDDDGPGAVVPSNN
jgi:hypothetical protein